MTYFTKLSLTGGEVPLEAAYDWARARCIMDVGGGRGEMLSRCMAAAGREVRGVLMDRQWVLDRWSPHFPSFSAVRARTAATSAAAEGTFAHMLLLAHHACSSSCSITQSAPQVMPGDPEQR